MLAFHVIALSLLFAVFLAKNADFPTKIFAIYLWLCYTIRAIWKIIKKYEFLGKKQRPKVKTERGNSNAQVCLPVH